MGGQVHGPPGIPSPFVPWIALGHGLPEWHGFSPTELQCKSTRAYRACQNMNIKKMPECWIAKAFGRPRRYRDYATGTWRSRGRPTRKSTLREGHGHLATDGRGSAYPLQGMEPSGSASIMRRRKAAHFCCAGSGPCGGVIQSLWSKVPATLAAQAKGATGHGSAQADVEPDCVSLRGPGEGPWNGRGHPPR